ncbi:DHHC palmitoyltransferase-domain-containing protein [Amylostereum chailletii]|nr:DHHC palmitoyltransferase-domain-containing protein [Amylostereum chailletii]
MANDGASTKFRSIGSMVDEARARRDRRTKQPWIALKLAVGLCSAIMIYTCYVYIGRLCVPMIRRDGGALGGRAMGVVFLVIFVLFAFMMIWSYMKILFTSPGHAVNYIPKVSSSDPSSTQYVPPPIPTARTESTRAIRAPSSRSRNLSDVRHEDTIGIPYAATRKPSITSTHSSAARLPPPPPPPRSNGEPAQRTRRPSSSSAQSPRRPSISTSASVGRPIVEKPANGSVRSPVERRPTASTNGSLYSTGYGNGPLGPLTRYPAPVPILRPEYRYCKRCCIVKPPRTHHCRQCGTCVMKFDHHCPWIGQCVGARNHKFFLVFVVWSLLFCLWTVSTLIGLNVRPQHPNRDVDPQHIVIIALSGLFALFTATMFVTHAGLISMNMTTVEHLAARSMKERESEVLGKLHPWHAFQAKRQTRREWDEEWGRIGYEGNVWWLGNVRTHWEQVMGPNPWTWFLPIGRSLADGLTYERNPRFDEDGHWLPRKTWPPELQ